MVVGTENASTSSALAAGEKLVMDTTPMVSPSKSPSKHLSIAGLMAMPVWSSTTRARMTRTPEVRSTGSRHMSTSSPSAMWMVSAISRPMLTSSRSSRGLADQMAVAESRMRRARTLSRKMLCLPPSR